MVADPMVVVLVVLNAALSAYGGWQIVKGWRVTRRGSDPDRLMMAGAARLLLAAGLWGLILLSSAWTDGLAPTAGRVGFGVCVALPLLAVVVQHRRRQLMSA